MQTAEDILRLRRFWEARLKPGQRLPLIIAKIEKPQALDNLDSIMAVRTHILIPFALFVCEACVVSETESLVFH